MLQRERRRNREMRRRYGLEWGVWAGMRGEGCVGRDVMGYDWMGKELIEMRLRCGAGGAAMRRDGL